MADKKTDYTIHVISNTHWDREWRFCFEETRLRLLEVLDKTIELFDKDPNFKHYHFDSQTLGLDDYLEIRPEKRKAIEKLVRSGKLLVGPWYSLPDEFSVLGESLARNLFMGHKVANSLGKVMKVGYNPFSFCGQVSQIAQLYNGFDIDTIIFYRGIGGEGNGKDFYLEAPDGSRVLNIRLTNRTRMNFLIFVGAPLYFGKLPDDSGKYHVNEKGRISRICNDELEARDFTMITEDYVWREDLLKERFEDLFERMKVPATTKHLIGMDGYDSSAPSQFTSKIIRLAREKLGYKIIHDSLPNTVAAIKKAVPRLPVIRKEMRFKGNTPIGAITARYYLKQQNRESEFNLVKLSEPLCILANKKTGHEYPSASFDMAWKALLANQSHDSIGGCSSDKVHLDMEQRFRKTTEIAKAWTKRACMSIAKNLDCSSLPDGQMALTIFNSLARPRTEVVDCYVMIPKEAGTSAPTLYSSNGRPVQALITKEKDWPANVEKFSMDAHSFADCTAWRIRFLAKDIPALGWQTYYIRSDRSLSTPAVKSSSAPKRTILENNYLKATINSNGTINLKDKKTGRTMKGLHFFEDRGECGGPWHSGVLPNDKPLTSKKCRAKVSVIEESDLASIREITINFRLPEDVTPDEKKRSSKLIDNPIVTRVILKKHSDMLEFETTVDNRAKSHKLRVMFPTGLSKAKTAEAEGQFDVVSRPIVPIDPSDKNLPAGDHLPGTLHAPASTHPQVSFMDISDGHNGLAIVNSAISEYEVINDRSRTVGISLLRTFPKLKIMKIFMDAKGGQCLGKGTFRYALVPHRGTWVKADLHHHAACHNVPLKPLQFLSDGKPGKLPLDYSFLKVEGVVVDCMKKADRSNSIIVRFHNPLKIPAKFKLSCGQPVKSAFSCNLNEERRKKLKVTKTSLIGSVPAGRIMTIELVV